jgi:hypothetical protein
MLLRKTILTIILALTTLSALLLLYGALPFLEKMSLEEYLPVSAKALATLIAAVAVLLGLRNEGHNPRTPDAPHRAPSIKSGLYSGLISGAVAGVIVAVGYYVANRDYDVGWARIPIIFLYGTASGALLGVAIQLGILLFSYLAQQRPIVFNEVTGGMAGGLVGGILAGALGGAIFYPMTGFEVDRWLLFAASVLGISVLVLGTLLYDYEGRWYDIFASLLVSLVVTVFVAGIAAFLYPMLQGAAFQRLTNWDVTFVELCGGAIIGLLLGTILGLEVGIGLRVYLLVQRS